MTAFWDHALTEVIATGNLVLDLPEDFPDLVFDGVRSARLLLEAMEVGEEFLVDEVTEVVADERLVVVDQPEWSPGRCPNLPSVGFIEDGGVSFAFQRGFVCLVLFQPVEILQEEKPGGLLGIVEFRGATGLSPENVVDVFEGLFKHSCVMVR